MGCEPRYSCMWLLLWHLRQQHSNSRDRRMLETVIATPITHAATKVACKRGTEQQDMYLALLASYGAHVLLLCACRKGCSAPIL